MSELERRIVRACLVHIEIDLVECRQVKSWWDSLSGERKREWKEFSASVISHRRAISEKLAESVDGVVPTSQS